MSLFTSTALVAAVYLITLGAFTPADLATGLILGICLSLSRPQAPRPRLPLVGRLAAAPRFLLAALWETTRGTWAVLLVVLGRQPWQRQGIVEIPIEGRSDIGITVTSLVAGLSPGTVLLEVLKDRGVMVFHVIDASDPERTRAQFQRFYQRFQRAVFP